MSDGWSIRDAGDAEALGAIEAPWRRLHASMPDARSYHGFAAAVASAHHPAPGTLGVRYLVVEDGSTIRAIVPLESRRDRSLGLPMTVTGLPWSDEWPLGDVVADSPEAARQAARLAVEWVAGRSPRSALLVLGPLFDDSLVWQGIEDSRRRAFIYPQGGWNYIECSGSYDDYLASLKKNFRGNLRKARNKLSAEKSVEWVAATGLAQVLGEFDTFMTLEASGWKGAEGTALSQHPWKVDWYRRWLRDLVGEGVVEINALYVDGACIASQLCVRTGATYEIAKIAYDEGHARLAPGQLLFEHTMKRCFDNPGIEIVDLLSDTPWHYDWAASPRPMSMGRVATSASGAMLMPLVRLRFRAMRQLVRKLKRTT